MQILFEIAAGSVKSTKLSKAKLLIVIFWIAYLGQFVYGQICASKIKSSMENFDLHNAEKITGDTMNLLHIELGLRAAILILGIIIFRMLTASQTKRQSEILLAQQTGTSRTLQEA